MTPLTGRALAAVVLAALLAGCGAGSGADGGRERGAGAPARSATTAPPAEGAGGAVRPLARSVPVGLRIPAIGVDTPVMRLGLAADGTVEVPPVTEDDVAGWYRHSPTPGRTGPSVLLGHVTVGSHGDGVFRRLARLHRGDRVEARLANGTVAGFAVTEVRTVAKADFPTDDVYGDVDRPELRLITCGGPRSGEEYRDNVIVFAELIATATTGGER
ncbi:MULTISPECIES: class F sortase [Streptomyces]|uniref:Class F sortase n=6 Tax=Streptomyces TaxID=1883 RepID=A0AAX3ZJT9_STRRO|nr:MULTISPECIES: class F sortase [Streptomyces]WDI19521.1 class F sortase [Streptomyces enissocaesilis]MDI3096852.1 class F sortase [Streptomyces sp. AN-3]QCR48545.1 class F sortase [Streptomyces sp. SGAir0924]RSS26973.1 class F sortase [Streptomyces sp. WAC05458]WMC87477.1 class F sortase [Streptomyces rochei]